MLLNPAIGVWKPSEQLLLELARYSPEFPQLR